MRLFKLLRRSPKLIALHLSLLLIIAGGFTTWLTAREDMVVLRQGEPVKIYGMELELESFETLYYPGGSMPRNYKSHLLVNGKTELLAVNEPLDIGKWRLYQQSFTEDGCSVIGLRADRPGTFLTFMGYGLFAIAGLLLLIKRGKRAMRSGCMILLAMSGPVIQATPVVKPEIADSLARVAVVYQGRVVPYSTVAHDALQKIFGKSRYKGLSAPRTVLSMTLFPEEWDSEPIIKTKKGHVSLNDCFDSDGRYLMYDDVDVDERVGVILLLRNGEFFSEAGGRTLSQTRVDAEILYNKLPSTLIIFIIFFTAAFSSFWRPRIGRVLGWAALALETAVIGLQCCLLGHGPFASTFETLQFMIVVVALLALLVKGAQGPGLMAAGCMALVAHLQHANPMVTPLMPVLHSPWLTLHVSIVMTSYALLAVVAAMAAYGLISERNEEEMRRQGLQLLHPAVYLLGLGIISGSVWANEAWGRYWGWDPKETAALITFLIYVIPLHKRKPSLWWLLLPLLSVAATYFGVNLLPSLHAYS